MQTKGLEKNQTCDLRYQRIRSTTVLLKNDENRKNS